MTKKAVTEKSLEELLAKEFGLEHLLWDLEALDKALMGKIRTGKYMSRPSESEHDAKLKAEIGKYIKKRAGVYDKA